MIIRVATKKLDALKADLFVVPVAEGAETSGTVKDLRPAARGAIETRVASKRFKGKAGATLLVQTPEGDVVLCGTGKNRSSESLRRAAAKGQAAATAVRARNVVLCAGSGA